MHLKRSEGQLAPAKTARLVHLALIGGVVLFAAVAWVVPTAATTPDAVLRTVLPAAALIGLSGALLFRRRLPASSPDETDDSWWVRAMPVAMVSWVMVEAVCLLASVTVFLAHDPMGLLWTGVGLGGFLLLSPGRLRESARSAP